ncbi:MAG: DNA polymerase III subunit beta [Deltaproteobacteria bacterium]|nr:DNA polymerase III subunit beta [Deltaproteobacteria bacterium]
MEFKINRAAFLKGLFLAQSIADRKSTTPALSNVLLRTDGQDSIVCGATDLHTSMLAQLPAEVLHEGGMSMTAKQLFDIVKSLPTDTIHFTKMENNWAKILAGKTRYKLVGMSDKDFPRLPDPNKVTFTEIPAPILVDMINKTLFSVSTDDTRQHLSGIYFECDGNRALMVSTDGHRLSKAEGELGTGPTLESGIIIPRKGVMEIKRLLETVDETCDIGFHDGNIIFRAQDIVLSVVLVDAQFPPYKQVIPSHNDKSIRLPRSALLESLKRISLMSSERSFGIRMELSKGRLRITTDNPDLGEALEDIDIDYDDEELTVGFNARYFIDILNEINRDYVILEFNGELDPGLVRPDDSRDYLGVVMPMRI